MGRHLYSSPEESYLRGLVVPAIRNVVLERRSSLWGGRQWKRVRSFNGAEEAFNKKLAEWA